MLRTYLKAKQICTIMLKRGDFKEKSGKHERISQLSLLDNYRYSLTWKESAISRISSFCAFQMAAIKQDSALCLSSDTLYEY